MEPDDTKQVDPQEDAPQVGDIAVNNTVEVTKPAESEDEAGEDDKE